MEIGIFYKSLNQIEKKKLLNLLVEEFANNVRVNNFTTMNEFIAKNHKNITTRTRNVLKLLDGFFIETVDPNDILKLRNGSNRVKNEFVKLRGY